MELFRKISIIETQRQRPRPRDRRIDATSSVRSLTYRDKVPRTDPYVTCARGRLRPHTYVKMPNSGNGDAPKFGGYLISLDGSLAGGRERERKREIKPSKERVQREPARRMLSIWSCPPSTGQPVQDRASRPLTPSCWLYLNSHYPRRRARARARDICTRLML